jgi:hypothetical protein
MPGATRRNKKNGGGWSQGPALSAEQYYLTEYKRYNECYPMARPGSIQSNPNPNLAQTGMAGGKKSRRNTKRNNRRNRKVGGSSCSEYFATRGGKRNTKRGGCGCGLRGGACPYMSGGGSCPFMRGGCGCMLQSGGGAIYGECPYKANSFNCPYTQGGAQRKQKKNKTRKNLKGGRYGVDPGVSVGGDGPNVAALTAHVPCEAYRPSPINPHHPNELVSAPETGIHFAGLSPGAVLKGGARRKNKKSKNLRSSLKGGEVNLVHTKFAAYTGVPISEKAPNMPTDLAHSHVAPQLQTADAQMYSGAPLTAKYPQPSLNGPKYNCGAPSAANQVVYTGMIPMDKYPQFVASQQPITSHQQIPQVTAAPPSGISVSHSPMIKPGVIQAGGQLRGDEHPLAYTAPRAGFAFVPNISQGQTLNPGQVPYQVVVPVDGSDSASCGLTCGQAIAQINKP